MRVAVAGATGNIGSLAVAALRRQGHDPIPISRTHSVDLSTGRGLDSALDGVEAVIDAISAPPLDRAATVAYFGAAARNLLEAEQRAGVRHHVLLTIVGLHRIEGNAHYFGKREQERIVAAGPVPWTIVPVTQFFDFGITVADWTEQDGRVCIPPLLVQPIAPSDVAEVLVEIACGPPQGRYRDVAGPEPQDLVDMARRTLDALGRRMRIVPTWDSVLGVEMAGNVLLPGPVARIAPTRFDDWLRSRHTQSLDPR